MKGIWFGSNEPPEKPNSPAKVQGSLAPKYALKHWMKFKYMLEPDIDEDLAKKKIVMPYCQCMDPQGIANIFQKYEALDKGKLTILQRNWCPVRCSNDEWK